ncbi:hypothetical protein LPJ56_005656, partial [Coemansia sp. RSA 2599]
RTVDAAAIDVDVGMQAMEHGYSCALVWITAGVLVGLLVGTASYRLKASENNEKTQPF